MSSRCNPRSLVYSEPDIPIVADLWLTSVQAHAHAHLDPLGPRLRGEVPLGIDGRGDRVLPTPKGDKERVPLSVDLSTAVCRERRSKNALMLGEHTAVVRAQLLQQLCRAFDVGEEKRDGAAWQLSHVAQSLPHAPEGQKTRLRQRHGALLLRCFYAITRRFLNRVRMFDSCRGHSL